MLLAWVASGPVYEPEAKSLYAQAIAPHASKLIWYSFREKLPAVSPPEPRHSTEPPRAEFKYPQEIVAGSPKAPRARQFIWQPAPQVELKQDLESPNLLAVHVPKPPPLEKPKLFVPPPAPQPAPQETPEIAAPPQLRAAAVPVKPPLQPALPTPVRPPPRPFVPPQLQHAAGAPAMLDAPPELRVARNLRAAGTIGNVLGAAPAKAPLRTFTAPRMGQGGSGVRPALPAPPSVEMAANLKAGGAAWPNAAALSGSASNAPVSLAIVGVNPHGTAVPSPAGSRAAQFSAGPHPRAAGGEGGPGKSGELTVPGLLIGGEPDTAREAMAQPVLLARAAPTSAGNLSAALRDSLPGGGLTGPEPSAMRVSSAPEGALDGRAIYAMSVQMPNITSYTGSWLIWFAERSVPPSGGLRPPVPLRKVDPKYYPSAIAEGIQGIVRLAAVIRADGQVDSVRLLHHLDDRLDRSAEEALEKWRFEPALRKGQPVAVDAVVEIPFRLAPKVTP
jgi:TonB family protein